MSVPLFPLLPPQNNMSVSDQEEVQTDKQTYVPAGEITGRLDDKESSRQIDKQARTRTNIVTEYYICQIQLLYATMVTDSSGVLSLKFNEIVGL